MSGKRDDDDPVSSLKEVRDAKVAAINAGDFDEAARMRYLERQMVGDETGPPEFWDSGD